MFIFNSIKKYYQNLDTKSQPPGQWLSILFFFGFFFCLLKNSVARSEEERSIILMLASDKEERDFYFWLIFGLWQGNYFNPVLCVSVIPFIRICDLKSIINNAAAKALSKKEKFVRTVNLLKNLEEQQKTIQKQIHLIRQAKAALMHNILKQ